MASGSQTTEAIVTEGMLNATENRAVSVRYASISNCEQHLYSLYFFSALSLRPRAAQGTAAARNCVTYT